MNGQDKIVGIGIHEVFVDQSPRGNDASDPPIMHETARLDLVGGAVGKLLCDSDMAVQVLNEDLEEPIQLEEGKAGLRG